MKVFLLMRLTEKMARNYFLKDFPLYKIIQKKNLPLYIYFLNFLIGYWQVITVYIRKVKNDAVIYVYNVEWLAQAN